MRKPKHGDLVVSTTTGLVLPVVDVHQDGVHVSVGPADTADGRTELVRWRRDEIELA